MAKKSRDKGKTAELEVVKALRPLFPDAARNLVQFRESTGRDLVETPGFVVQISRRAGRPAVEVKLREAALAVQGDEIPVHVTRGDRGPWLAVLYFEDLIALAAALLRLTRVAEEGPSGEAADENEHERWEVSCSGVGADTIFGAIGKPDLPRRSVAQSLGVRYDG